MPVIAALRSRLRDERGFTLIELLVGLALSTLVMIAAMNIYDATVRASARVSDRVDANQHARLGLDQAVRELRSAGCPSGGYQEILLATATRVVYHADSDGDSDGVYDPEVHELDVLPSGTRSQLVLRSYTGKTSATAPATGPPAAPPVGWTPYVDRPLISDLVTPPVSGFPGGAALNVLQYFDINGTELTPPVTGTALQGIASINLNVAVSATSTGTKDMPIRLQGSAYPLRTDRTASTDAPTFSC